MALRMTTRRCPLCALDGVDISVIAGAWFGSIARCKRCGGNLVVRKWYRMLALVVVAAVPITWWTVESLPITAVSAGMAVLSVFYIRLKPDPFESVYKTYPKQPSSLRK